ncbi:hypothetical protein JZ785_27500 (plasmid) [Alicyclobacillus curvatus]|nr:hypothetical protein JZ785_27500 [Alicyclobacillus curvatus]
MTEDSQRLERIEDLLTQLIKTVGSTNSMVTHLQSQMSTLQTQVGALEQKVVNLQGDIGVPTAKRKFRTLSGKVA